MSDFDFIEESPFFLHNREKLIRQLEETVERSLEQLEESQRVRKVRESLERETSTATPENDDNNSTASPDLFADSPSRTPPRTTEILNRTVNTKERRRTPSSIIRAGKYSSIGIRLSTTPAATTTRSTQRTNNKSKLDSDLDPRSSTVKVYSKAKSDTTKSTKRGVSTHEDSSSSEDTEAIEERFAHKSSQKLTDKKVSRSQSTPQSSKTNRKTNTDCNDKYSLDSRIAAMTRSEEKVNSTVNTRSTRKGVSTHEYSSSSEDTAAIEERFAHKSSQKSTDTKESMSQSMPQSSKANRRTKNDCNDKHGLDSRIATMTRSEGKANTPNDNSSSSEDSEAIDKRFQHKSGQKSTRKNETLSEAMPLSKMNECNEKYFLNSQNSEVKRSMAKANTIGSARRRKCMNDDSTSSEDSEAINKRFELKSSQRSLGKEETLAKSNRPQVARSESARRYLADATQLSISSEENEEEMKLRFEKRHGAEDECNRLSSPKRNSDGWNKKSLIGEEGMLGKVILVRDGDDKSNDDERRSVSDLGGSQDIGLQRPSRSRIKGSPADMRVTSASSKCSFQANVALNEHGFRRRSRGGNDIDDNLWDDSQDEDAKRTADSNGGDATGKRRGRKKESKSADDHTRANKRSLSRPQKTRDVSLQLPKKRPSPEKVENAAPARRQIQHADETPEESDEIVSDDEEERMSGELKPDFKNPKLGPPGPLEPFILSLTNDNEHGKPCSIETNVVTHCVPAAINRYLQEYQRVGIQFMYSSVIEGKGCVLGDDMGLGKTVQVISLIAALFQKSGTGLDEMTVKRHRRAIDKAVQAKEKAVMDALIKGERSVQASDPFEGIDSPEFSPILIVVPSTVIQNWMNEFATWGHFNVSVYEGNNREKALSEVIDRTNFIMVIGKLFKKEPDFSNLLKVQWKIVFIDEFHEFKNPETQASQCLQRIRDDCRCPLVGMTGTLMQNNHDELFALINLVRPNLLGDKTSFKDYISKPIMLARTKDAGDEIKFIGDERNEELSRTLSPVFLMRKKEDVLKLTEKNEKVIFCELSDIQKKLYLHLLSLPDFYLLRMANAPCCVCNSNQQYFIGYKRMKTLKEQLNYQRRHKNELKPNKSCCLRYPKLGMQYQELDAPIDPDAVLWKQQHRKENFTRNEISSELEIFDDKYVSCVNCPTCISFPAMMKLHHLCSHPSLLQVDRTDTGPMAQKKLEFAKIAFPPEILRELPGGDFYRADGIMDDHLKLSGKMKTLNYCLRKFQRKRDRVLVFSYSTATLDLIQQHVKTKGWTHLRLDGKTPTSSRQSLVDQFQNDEGIFLFLISTKAGGLGLNLTAANKVIVFDVSWNPTNDEQAQDRAYRIGQRNDVDVIRLVARGTIEEQIYARQVYKIQLTKQTLRCNADGKNQPQIYRAVDKDPNRKGELFGLENLLKYKDGSFMQLLWKKSNVPNEAHDVSEIEHFTELDWDEAIGEGGIDAEVAKSTHIMESNSESEDEAEVKVNSTGFNHQDLFNEDRGRARISKGDENFEDEMGGESQMIQVATKIACEHFESDSSEDDCDDVVVAASPVLKDSVLDTDMEKDTNDRPSPVRSSVLPLTAVPLDTINNENTYPIWTGSTEDSPPRTQPSQTRSNRQVTLTTQPHVVSNVSIMGAVFDNSTIKKCVGKKSSLYIPTYKRNEKAIN